MNKVSAADTVRRYFEIWTSGDRAAMESALADEFRFTSPRDDRIDKETFFERCWPHHGEIRSIDLEVVAPVGDRLFVRYLAHRASDGTRFRNTEVITLKDGKIAEVDVYFGRDLDPRVTDDDEEAVRKCFKDKATVLREKSAPRAATQFAPEARTFDLAPPLETRGSPTDRERGIAEWFATWDGPIHLETQDLDVDVSGDLAVAHGLHHMTGTKKDGDKPDVWYRATTVLRRIDGRWLVTHEHESVPFDMTTFQASLDLKP